MQYPIAEIFESLQGEGVYAGTPMLFIRLAGCSVGHYSRPSMQQEPSDQGHPFRLLAKEPNHSICETAMGQQFLCDTNYKIKMRKSSGELASLVGQHQHVCLTGGEPFNHVLDNLLRTLFEKTKATVHIETSGTVPLSQALTDSYWGYCDDRDRMWITCSPKKDYLTDFAANVDEFKFVINFRQSFDEKEMADKIEAIVDPPGSGLKFLYPIYIQPANPVMDIDEESMHKAIDFVRKYPWLRLCNQQHKFWGLR